MRARSERGERSVGARRGRRGILQAAVRRCRGPCAGSGRAGRCVVSAGAGGRGRGGGAAQAAPGPGEWSNLTAGTRRRRAGGNGGGGGGAGRHREAWAVTRAPERAPMVLEGPRRPVLQVRRAPAEPLCVLGGERLRPAPHPPPRRRPRGRPRPGPAPRAWPAVGTPVRADGAASPGPRRRGLQGVHPHAGLRAPPEPALRRDFVRPLGPWMGTRAPRDAEWSRSLPPAPGPWRRAGVLTGPLRHLAGERNRQRSLGSILGTCGGGGPRAGPPQWTPWKGPGEKGAGALGAGRKARALESRPGTIVRVCWQVARPGSHGASGRSHLFAPPLRCFCATTPGPCKGIFRVFDLWEISVMF